MKKRIQKVVKDPVRVESMHKLQQRIAVLGKRAAKAYTNKAWKKKIEKELEDTINKFVGHIKEIKKGETHELHRRAEKHND